MSRPSPGTTNYSAIAIDYAGNTSLTATTSITVSVTPGSLCKLVERWVDNRGVCSSSSRYSAAQEKNTTLAHRVLRL